MLEFFGGMGIAFGPLWAQYFSNKYGYVMPIYAIAILLSFSTIITNLFLDKI